MKSGVVVILGRPNVGKSTLINYIVGSKISITSPKPQTTRFKILGVRNFPDAQIVFVDTPGFHLAKKALNKYLVEVAVKSLEGADIVYLLVEATDFSGREYPEMLNVLKRTNAPVFLIINKVDICPKKDIEEAEEAFKDMFSFKEIFRISALTGRNVDILLEKTKDNLTEGPLYFPIGMITALTRELQVAEVVREKIFLFTRQELPYETAVNVDDMQMRENGMLYVKCTIYVATSSQKGILIGSKGSMIKKIGIEARKDLEFISGKPIYLELNVKVEKDWPEKEEKLKKFGYIT